MSMLVLFWVQRKPLQLLPIAAMLALSLSSWPSWKPGQEEPTSTGILILSYRRCSGKAMTGHGSCQRRQWTLGNRTLGSGFCTLQFSLGKQQVRDVSKPMPIFCSVELPCDSGQAPVTDVPLLPAALASQGDI